MQTLIDAVATDLRQTLRDLRRAPGLTLAIVATLALGVGVNAAMFTVLDRILFRQPDGVRNAGEVRRLYQVGRGFQSEISYSDWFSAPDLDGLRDAVKGVARVAGVFSYSVQLLDIDADTTRVGFTRVTQDYFDLLGVVPQRGRFFAPDEMQYGDPRYVAVLSDGLWRRRFGADSSVIGRTVRTTQGRDTTSYTIVGVAAPGFSGIEVEADGFWVPFTARGGRAGEGRGSWWTQRGVWIVSLIARIPDTTDVRSVEARFTTAVRNVNAGAGSWFDRNMRILAAPLVEARGPRFSAGSTRELTLATRLAGMSLVVLLLAIANVAGLMLMRSLARQREMAIRVALGVSRFRIATRLAIEGLVITSAAVVVATLLAHWTGGVLRPLLFSSVQWLHPLVDGRVVALVVVMTALATIASSIAPFVLAGRPEVMSLLKAGELGVGNPASRLRSTFLASQTAICVALLAAAGLFIQSLHRAVTVDLGYDPERLVLAGASGYGNASPSAQFSALATQLATSPGVEAVAQSGIGGGGTIGTLKLDGRDPIPMEQAPSYNLVDGKWAEVMGLRMRAGRSFTADEVASGVPAAMINRAMAEKFWPGQNPLGQCLGTTFNDCSRVVGVFENIRYELAAGAAPYYVLPVQQTRGPQPSLLLRYTRAVTDDDVARVRAAVVAAVGPTRAFLRTIRVGAGVERQLRPWRIAAALLSIFAIVGLASAGAAVFGLVSYDVGRRTREIGVRTALGATGGRVVRDVLRPSLRVIVVGIVAGIVIALASGRVMASLLFETSAADPVVLLLTATVLGFVAAIAGFVPAFRATKINPVVALQAD
jgi:predicted permease